VNRAAIEVARRDGVEAATLATWRPLLASPASLGGHGPKHIEGHACPHCASAINELVGSASARTRAVVAYLGRSSPQKAERLRSVLANDYSPMLPAWGALKQVPSLEPWAHLSQVIDRL
jgi:hypothetical protein